LREDEPIFEANLRFTAVLERSKLLRHCYSRIFTSQTFHW
jgi:hypothetical protein